MYYRLILATHTFRLEAAWEKLIIDAAGSVRRPAGQIIGQQYEDLNPEAVEPVKVSITRDEPASD